MNKWIRRKRNSLGFGVQSPTDFYFVQHVLREVSPYYAYAELEKAEKNFRADLPHYPEKINKLLFRLANYIHPEVIVEVGTGSGLSAYAMSMARSLGKCVTINEYPTIASIATEVRSILSHLPQITVEYGDERKLFEQLLATIGTIELLHVAHTPHYKEVVALALQHISDKALIIIEDIYNDKEKRTWWKELCNNPLTGICYDMDCIGLLLIAPSRSKNTYWIDFKE